MKKSTGSSTRNEIFVDTSGYFALLAKKDSAHASSVTLMERAARSSSRFVTTDYVLDETATLLKARRHGHLIGPFFETVLSSKACRIEWMDPDTFDQTQRFFQKHLDHDWSFTDCFSFQVMQALGIRDALTTDAHFRQAGFNPLLLD